MLQLIVSTIKFFGHHSVIVLEKQKDCAFYPYLDSVLFCYVNRLVMSHIAICIVLRTR
jgi:hypothetical protein